MHQKTLVISGDKMALGRLLNNLITNALNHGKPPVEVALDIVDGNALITVSDHGPGISAERRIEALRPFSRLDDARTLIGSVGLGLALADRSEEHTSELQSLMRSSYAVFCLKKKTHNTSYN